MQEGLLNTKLAMTMMTKMTATTTTTRAGAVMLYCGTLGISEGKGAVEGEGGWSTLEGGRH